MFLKVCMIIDKIFKYFRKEYRIKNLELKEQKLCLIEKYEKEESNKNELRLKRGQKRTKLNHFYIKLTQHCNLKCRCCDEFSPLAKQEFINTKQLHRDLRRLAKLTKKQVDTIILSGGEPLLNPELTDIIKLVAKHFPDSNLELFTNGILVGEMGEDFWQICKEYNVKILVTVYPIKVDYNNIFNKAKKHKVVCVPQNIIVASDVKTTWHLPLDLSGSQNIPFNFLNCMHANHCFYLDKGKLYTCSIAGNISHFNEFFDKNLIVTENDYIDIYKVKNIDEILEFLSNPIPFCKYCNIEKRSINNKWGKSEFGIEEWMLD